MVDNDLFEFVVYKCFHSKLYIFMTNISQYSSVWIKGLFVAGTFYLVINRFTSFGNNASFNILENHNVFYSWANIWFQHPWHSFRIKHVISTRTSLCLIALYLLLIFISSGIAILLCNFVKSWFLVHFYIF